MPFVLAERQAHVALNKGFRLLEPDIGRLIMLLFIDALVSFINAKLYPEPEISWNDEVRRNSSMQIQAQRNREQLRN